jgi:glucose-6-phosphate dehydrogenase assembly protein OpcA
MPTVSDAVWEAQGTTPGAVEAALRRLLFERHQEAEEFVPARTLNMVVVVDREFGGEIANRLRRVGRFHAARTVVLALDPGKDGLDARAALASDTTPQAGRHALLRETVVLTVGGPQADDLFTIADPLVVSDLPTVLWSPHGHPEAVEALLPLAQVVLLDASDAGDAAEAFARAATYGERSYVVDLAWLRSTPWRERIAASFDPPALRGQLDRIARFEVRHAPDSQAAALLLCGWLASRLGWEPQALHDGRGRAKGRKDDVRIELREDASMRTRGLAGITIESASGQQLSLDRGTGGLRARYVGARGEPREWTVLGASRGESGILGEGIRQALLRDPTYRPALEAARAFAG